MSVNKALMSKRFRNLLMKHDAFIAVNNLQAGAHIITKIDLHNVPNTYNSVTKRTVKKWWSQGLITQFDRGESKICTYFKLNPIPGEIVLPGIHYGVQPTQELEEKVRCIIIEEIELTEKQKTNLNVGKANLDCVR